jgi:hypothetical protein
MAPTEITVTHALARRMASVAEAAADPAIRGALTREHRNAIHAVARRVVSDGGARGIAGTLGAADPDATLATTGLDDETFRTYLDALDQIATKTATPHHRQACTTVFTSLVDDVDVDAKGLHFQQFQTLEPKSESSVFG